MTTITKASVAWDGLPANIGRAIAAWSPGDLHTEAQYRNSLASHLRECAPGARVECEYRHLGTTVDIYVEWDGLISTDEAFLELKRNLRTKSEFNRLVGQIDDLRPGKHMVIVVLCGETSPTWLGRLKARYKGLFGFGLWLFSVPTTAATTAASAGSR